MSRMAWQETVAEARRRGFTHVRTMAGPLELAQWTPYGNGIQHRWYGEWVADDQVQDSPEGGVAHPFILGRWTFTREA